MIAGQGFDSLHPAKHRMFLYKKKCFSTVFLPSSAKNGEKWQIIAPVAFFLSKLSLFLLPFDRISQRTENPRSTISHYILFFLKIPRQGKAEKPQTGWLVLIIQAVFLADVKNRWRTAWFFYVISVYYIVESCSAASGIGIQSSLHRFSAKVRENRPSLIRSFATDWNASKRTIVSLCLAGRFFVVSVAGSWPDLLGHAWETSGFFFVRRDLVREVLSRSRPECLFVPSIITCHL